MGSAGLIASLIFNETFSAATCSEGGSGDTLESTLFIFAELEPFAELAKACGDVLGLVVGDGEAFAASLATGDGLSACTSAVGSCPNTIALGRINTAPRRDSSLLDVEGAIPSCETVSEPIAVGLDSTPFVSPSLVSTPLAIELCLTLSCGPDVGAFDAFWVTTGGAGTAGAWALFALSLNRKAAGACGSAGADALGMERCP